MRERDEEKLDAMEKQAKSTACPCCGDQLCYTTVGTTNCDSCGVEIHMECGVHKNATFATPEGTFCRGCTEWEK